MFYLLLSIPFQEPLKLITDCPTLVQQFRQKHGSFVTECNPDTTAGLTVHSHSLPEVEDILYHYRRFSSDILALHGAAVAARNGARLLLAPTTGGKTTLTCYLTQNGMDYITDDCILIHKNTLQVHPYPEPLHLRKESLAVLHYYHVSPEYFTQCEQLNNVTFPRHVYTPVNCVTNPLPIHSIYFLERTENQNTLQPMPTTACISALLQAPIMEYPMNASYIHFMTVLAKYPCYKLCYNDMNYVLNIL